MWKSIWSKIRCYCLYSEFKFQEVEVTLPLAFSDKTNTIIHGIYLYSNVIRRIFIHCSFSANVGYISVLVSLFIPRFEFYFECFQLLSQRFICHNSEFATKWGVNDLRSLSRPICRPTIWAYEMRIDDELGNSLDSSGCIAAENI